MLNSNSIFSKTYKKKRKKDEKWRAYYQMILTGFFVGIIVSSFFATKTLISLFTITKFFAFFAFTGLLIPYKYYKKWFDFKIFEMFMMNILCFGPVLLSIFLVLNYFITFNQYQKTFHIDLPKTSQHIKKPYNKVEFYYKEDKLKDFSGLRTFESRDLIRVGNVTQVRYTFAKGLFSYEVEKGHQFIVQKESHSR